MNCRNIVCIKCINVICRFCKTNLLNFPVLKSLWEDSYFLKQDKLASPGRAKKKKRERYFGFCNVCKNLSRLKPAGLLTSEQCIWEFYMKIELSLNMYSPVKSCKWSGLRNAPRVVADYFVCIFVHIFRDEHWIKSALTFQYCFLPFLFLSFCHPLLAFWKALKAWLFQWELGQHVG